MRTLFTLLLVVATPAVAQPCFLAFPAWDAYSLEEKASSVEQFLNADSLAFDLKRVGQIHHLVGMETCLTEPTRIYITTPHPAESNYLRRLIQVLSVGLIAAGISPELPFNVIHIQKPDEPVTIARVVFIGRNLSDCIIPWRKE